ncbi:MAG: S8 family serine peptidase [Candidatus Thermoplasmatota archaeon]|nr:S8 family serine peptidase [Candidatus Thermoplasmatota archaeon]
MTFCILAVLLLASAAPFSTPHPPISEVYDEPSPSVERIEIIPDPNSIQSASPSGSWDGEELHRETIADTHLGIFTIDGLQSDIEVPEVLTTIRTDIALVLIDGEVGLWDGRVALTELPGIEVRAHIPPSGFLIQGHPHALAAAAKLPMVSAVHSLPLAFMVDQYVSDLLSDASSLSLQSSPSTAVQLSGWRLADLSTPQDHVRLPGLIGDLDQTAEYYLTDHRPIDTGRHLGILSLDDIATVAAEPALSWLSLEPVFIIDNSLAVGHIKADDVSDYFIVGLNGSGHTVTVADSGIDQDHGDFNGRIQHVESVIWGDSSTEDEHSGHGTHVACTVLGNGSRGGYAGVAPQATLRFQAMEDDSSGNFGGVSMDTLIRKGYEGNSYIHTNSWGTDGYYGEYTTSSEDTDSRTSQYDQFWSYNGMLVLVSAGNDGPDSDTITPPATAKNAVAVGNHYNRGGSNSQDTLADGSSRGPTDDGRIKPDVTAPGSWVRSCRSQDAGDTSGASWSSTWYLEYSGTSMAAPNAAGASVLIREYLMEVAGRPSPQGALIKGMLILGAEDMGSRDIPNMNEGWGRVNLANSLIPGTDTGVWVDDRNTIRSGQTREYEFNLSRGNTPFKAVLTWSDYPGSTWSSTQLQNNLDMVITAPDGTVYKGNDFANGRSTTGGDADDVNNVEVVLIDQADAGVWTVQITDVAHGGQRSDQPFALAVRGAGVNDLRSDPIPVPVSFELSTSIPQVNEQCQFSIQIENQGGGAANGLQIEAIAGTQNLGDIEIDLGPGMMRWVTWDWTPLNEGTQAITIRIDPDNLEEEIDEDNNLFEIPVAVSAPGVRVTTAQTVLEIEQASQTSTSWQLQIRNTALISTNASISSSTPMRLSNGQMMSGWFTSFTQTNFALDGSEASTVGFTLVHDESPSPGLYQLTITARDDDNNIEFPLTLSLNVPTLSDVSFQAPFSTLQVHPAEPTSFIVDVQNEGNGLQGYNLFIESPIGWWVGLDNLGSSIGSSSGSTGAIPLDGARTVEMTVTPQIGTPPPAGQSLQAILRVTSQVDPTLTWSYTIQMEVIEFDSAIIEAESTLSTLRPDSTVYLQYTISNLGNTELTFNPNIDDRPGGWSVIAGSNSITIPIGESASYMLGLEGNGLAVGGSLTLHLTTQDGYRITWEGALDVVEEAKPVITLTGITDSEGMAISEIPVGNPGFVGHWLIINDGSSPWTPTLSLDLPDSTWEGICDPVAEIPAGGSSEANCIITAPEFAMAGWQPEIGLTINADGIERSASAFISIAADPSVVWKTISLEESMEGESSLLHFNIENTGNTVIQERLVIEAPEGWSVEIQDSDIIDIPLQESQDFRVLVTPGSAGEESIELKIEGWEIPGSTHSVSMDVLSNPTTNTEGNFGTRIAIIALVVFIIVGIGIAGLLIIRLRETRSPSTTPSAPPPNAFVPNKPIETSPKTTTQVVCWGCNQPIQGNRRACPKCGARYHESGYVCSASSLTVCRNCQADVNTFVEELSS